MTAKEARKKADQINGLRDETQYKEIKKAIDAASADGRYEIIWFDPIRLNVKSKLISQDGYLFASEHTSQKDGTTITITW
jgi:hypothetical protein